MAGLFPWLGEGPLKLEDSPFTVDFCSYQASISVEKESARLSLLPLLLEELIGLSQAMAGTAVTVPDPGAAEAEEAEGLAGSSGGTDSRLVEDRWLTDPDRGESLESTNVGRCVSLSDFRLLALVFRNLVEYL